MGVWGETEINGFSEAASKKKTVLWRKLLIFFLFIEIIRCQ